MNQLASDSHEEWYAVRTKPQEEDRADLNLRTGQVQTFAPKLKELRTSGYGSEYVSKPLFNRYIFAHFNVSKQLHQVNYTRGVQNVVSFGGNPVSIDEKVITLIRSQVSEEGFLCRDDTFESGDRVRINSGPFKSLLGIFQRPTKDKERVKILLDAMNNQSHLLIERGMVEKVT
jgi:transcriptional antiterminator RfaH